MKVLGIIFLLTSLTVQAQQAQIVELNKSLSCKGPGFGYSELDVALKDKLVDVRFTYYFSSLYKALRQSGSELQAGLKEVKFSFSSKACLAIKNDAELIRCENRSSPAYMNLFDSNGEFIDTIELNHIKLTTIKKLTGLFVDIEGILTGSNLGFSEEAVLDNNIDSPHMALGCVITN